MSALKPHHWAAGVCVAFALTQAAHAQLPFRISECLATETADAASQVCPIAWQAYGVSAEDWDRAVGHDVDLLLAEDRAEEVRKTLFRVGPPHFRSPQWYLLMGLANAHTFPSNALFDFEDAINGGFALTDERRTSVLAITRDAGRAALDRLKANAYPTDVPSWKMEHRPESDRSTAMLAFNLILTLEPEDAEAQAVLDWLAQTVSEGEAPG